MFFAGGKIVVQVKRGPKSVLVSQFTTVHLHWKHWFVPLYLLVFKILSEVQWNTLDYLSSYLGISFFWLFVFIILEESSNNQFCLHWCKKRIGQICVRLILNVVYACFDNWLFAWFNFISESELYHLISPPHVLIIDYLHSKKSDCSSTWYPSHMSSDCC